MLHCWFCLPNFKLHFSQKGIFAEFFLCPLRFLFFGFIRFLLNLAQLLMKGCSTNLLRLFYFWWIQLMIFQVELFTKLYRCHGNTICWKPKSLSRFVGECLQFYCKKCHGYFVNRKEKSMGAWNCWKKASMKNLVNN